MATTRELAVKIVGDASSAVKAFDDTADAAGRANSKFDAARAGITVASAAVVAAVGAFAISSVDAFAEAEQSQAALVAAYEKFPALADTNIDALRALNTEIQRKTGFDDDQLAAAQATLAQFGLTGEQIQQLTPLMADYAAKTGKDLTTAAEGMGKAVLGQGRALKEVGVDFTDTGDAAANFDQLVAGLDGTVGGFAETMGGTAAGKMAILEAGFGDIQETVGEMLIPALSLLVDVGTTVTNWMADNPEVVQALAIAIGILTVAIIAANIAMWALSANPIVLLIMAIIIAVGLLIAGIWLLVTNWDTVVAWITEVWSGFMSWITEVIDGFVQWWNGVWTEVGNFFTDLWEGFLNWVKDLWIAYATWLYGVLDGFVSFWSGVWDGISRVFQDVWEGLVGIVKGVWNGILGWIEGGVNGAIDLINGMIDGVNTVGGAFGIQLSYIPTVSLPRLANGGVTTGPMVAVIGDNPGGREVVQPLDSAIAEIRRAYESGLNSRTTQPQDQRPVEIHVYPQPGMSEEQTGRSAAEALTFALRGVA